MKRAFEELRWYHWATVGLLALGQGLGAATTGAGPPPVRAVGAAAVTAIVLAVVFAAGVRLYRDRPFRVAASERTIAGLLLASGAAGTVFGSVLGPQALLLAGITFVVLYGAVSAVRV